jgi:non-heme chloroperoxidase
MSYLPLAILGVLLALAPVPPQQTVWSDPSPHTVKFVPVDTDVTLEVLDWGGSGPEIVLLAGLGDTAHVFDDFATMLTGRYRVIGVTRRGHGRSSAPHAGYGFTRLADDVVRVIDAAGLKKPVVIGHSIAGEELHVLGARDSERIRGLVYIDAAFDRGDNSDNEAYAAVARTLPASPRPGPADLASFATLSAFLVKTQGFSGPEAYLRARWTVKTDGSVAGMWAPELPIRQAMTTAMQAAYKSYHPDRIRVPALALYAEPKSPADMMRSWYPTDDAAVRDRVAALTQLEIARVENHIRWFEQFADQRRVARIAGKHHLFLSNSRDVLQHIETFLSSLPGAAIER